MGETPIKVNLRDLAAARGNPRTEPFQNKGPILGESGQLVVPTEIKKQPVEQKPTEQK